MRLSAIVAPVFVCLFNRLSNFGFGKGNSTYYLFVLAACKHGIRASKLLRLRRVCFTAHNRIIDNGGWVRLGQYQASYKPLRIFGILAFQPVVGNTHHNRVERVAYIARYTTQRKSETNNVSLPSNENGSKEHLGHHNY